MKRTDIHQSRWSRKLFLEDFVQYYVTIARPIIISFLFIGLMFILTIGLSQASEQAKVQSPNPPAVPSASLKTIIVGNYYPYTFVNDKKIPDGFSVDIAKAVAGVMDLKLEIKEDTWENAIKALANGTIDFLPMMAASPERDKHFDFSVPHTIAYDAIFLKNETPRISSLKDLGNKTVIVMNKDAAHDYLLSTGMAARMKLVLVDSLPDALRTLAAGKGDAALMPKLVGLIVMKKLQLTNLDPSPVVIDGYNRPFSFAVKEGNQYLLEHLSQGLSIIKTTGRYQEIYNKWFGTFEPPGLSMRTVIKYIAGIVAVFLLIALGLILWMVSLRKQVSLRTKKLEAEIHERKQAEEALRESEKKYRLVVDNMADIISVMDMNLRFTYVSPSIMRMRGFTVEEAMAQTLEQVMTPESLQIIAKVFEEEMKLEASGTADPDRSRILELEEYRKDGSIVWIENNLSFVRDEAQKPVGIISLSRDITDRKQGEEKLRESEKKYRELYNFLPIPVYEMDLETNITSANRAIYETFKGTEEDLKKGVKAWQLISPEEIEKSSTNIQRLLKGEQVKETEYTLMRLDGSVFPAMLFSSVIYRDGKPVGLRGAIVDITERKQAEDSLRESEERFKNLYQESPIPTFTWQKKGDDFILVDINHATIQITNHKVGDFLGNSAVELYRNRPQVLNDMNFCFQERSTVRREIFSQHFVPGRFISVHYGFIPPDLIIVHMEDQTERKRAEEELVFNNIILRTQQESSIDGILVVDEKGKILSFNQRFVDLWGIPPDVIESKSDERALQLVEDKLASSEEFIHKVKHLYEVQDEISRDEIFLKDGRSFDRYSAPMLSADGKYYGRVWYFRDITERKQAEEEKKKSFDQLRKALGATVQAIATVVEMRDPYTAGHQTRVADLARSIASEMELSKDQIDSIRIAGLIHDIGKISVPAEILSKPTKLTDLEFSLIKTHTQSGYDILKDIEFPWPIARIVHEHHERMDGSGYPNGLFGDQILLESRILIVADVVEAIASHRPYRPALGIDAALAEIEENRGLLYDPEAADACLRLFREKGYSLN
ncbi:MAG: PAS domain S-box protein [Pseudomonadota bacterium]